MRIMCLGPNRQEAKTYPLVLIREEIGGEGEHNVLTCFSQVRTHVCCVSAYLPILCMDYTHTSPAPLHPICTDSHILGDMQRRYEPICVYVSDEWPRPRHSVA